MSDIKIVAQNKKARFNYEILETYEAGIELKGTEVKSVRMSKVNISDGYVSIDNSEAYLKQVHISPYEQGNIFNADPLRVRKLLLHKREIKTLWDAVRIKGMTIVPIRVYLKAGKAKLEIGIAKGKKLYDKRESIKERDIAREGSRRSSDY